MRFNLCRMIDVWDDIREVTISVEEDDGYVNISTKKDKDKQYFGEIDLTLHKDMAKLLAKAILELTGE